MCIIVAKPENICMPSKDVLKNCFSNNRDGAGLMYAYKGAVYISKGFMTFEDLDAEVDALSKKFDIDKISMVLHFRIGTQGRNDEANTHPFPVSDEIEKLTAKKIVCNTGVAHNGIISLTRSYYSTDYSDTVLFVRDYLSCLVESPTFYKKPKMLKVIDKLAGSKLAFLSNDGHITTIGNFINHEGVMYSNATYSYGRSTVTYSNGYNYDYDDNYYNNYNRGAYGASSVPATTYQSNYKYLSPIRDDDKFYLMDKEFEWVQIYEGKYFLADDGKVYGFDSSTNKYVVVDGLRLYDDGSKPVVSKYEQGVSKYALIDNTRKFSNVQYTENILKERKNAL